MCRLPWPHLSGRPRPQPPDSCPCFPGKEWDCIRPASKSQGLRGEIKWLVCGIQCLCIEVKVECKHSDVLGRTFPERPLIAPPPQVLACSCRLPALTGASGDPILVTLVLVTPCAVRHVEGTPLGAAHGDSLVGGGAALPLP